MQLDFTLQFTDDTWYPTVDIHGFTSAEGQPVDIQEKMVLSFSAPGKITEGDITVTTNPWCAIKTVVQSSEISSGIFDIKLTITATDGSALGGAISDIHMGVNVSSDSAPAWSMLRNTFSLAADEETDVTGELLVSCETFPIGLEACEMELTLTRGEKQETLHPVSGANRFRIAAGTYAASVAELRTAQGTVRATVQLSAASLNITKGQCASLAITFAPAERSTTLDVTLNLPSDHALYGEVLTLVYLENDDEVQRAALYAGKTLRLEQRPVQGRYTLSINDITLNNVHYRFDAQSGSLDNGYHAITFNHTHIHQNEDVVSRSSVLNIAVEAEKNVAATFALRLVEESETPRQYCFAPLSMQTGRHPPSETLAPGVYHIASSTFIQNSTLYYIDILPEVLHVAEGMPVAVNVAIREGANLSVKGFPDFLSVGGSQWVYDDFTYDGVFDPEDGQKKKLTISPALAGKLSAQYALLVGVFDETQYVQADCTPAIAKGADFMAVDRYEADDFTARAYKNGYCYSPYEWDRTFDYCAALSRHLRQPVLPWQMPTSRLASVSDNVGELEEQFWGTGGSYLMGHAEIGNTLEAINPKLLNIEFLDVHASMMGRTPRELFSRHEWDFSGAKYQDFPSRGIFHVQVGGGATTGVVSAVNRNSSRWMREKLQSYRKSPVKFNN